MTRIKYLISGSLVIILSLFLINYSGLLSQSDVVDLETNPYEDNEAIAKEKKQTDRASSKPNPAPTFDHQVDMKINGILEENKGEEWWVLD